MLLIYFNSINCPTHRGRRLRVGHRLKYLQSSRYPISMMLQALTLLQRLPLLQEVIHKSSSYIV